MAKTHRLSPWQLPTASWARISTWKVSDKAVPGDGAASAMCLLLSSCVSQGWGQRCGAYSVGPGLETPNLLGVSRGRGMQVWMLLLGGVLLVSHGATLPLPAPCPLMTAVTLLRTLVPSSATGGAHTVRHIFQVFRHGGRAMAHGTLSCCFHAADERLDAQTCRGFPKSSSQEDAGSGLNPGSGGPGLRVLQASPAEPRVLVAGGRASPAAWPQQGLTFLEGLSGASEMLPASGPGWDGGFAQLSQPGARTTIAGSQHL